MTNQLEGLSLIGGQAVRGEGPAFRAFDPALGQALEPDFHAVSTAQVEQACALAGLPAPQRQQSPREQRPAKVHRTTPRPRWSRAFFTRR